MNLSVSQNQKYSGKGTSVNSQKLPIIYKHVKFKSKIVLDYGCGKYTDHIARFVEDQGIRYVPFDPFNKSEEVNRYANEVVSDCISRGERLDIVCSNVLNVIAEDHIVQKIADLLMQIADLTGGSVYVTVYFDKRYSPGEIKPGQYQRHEPIENYLRFFPEATILYRVLTYEGRSGNANIG